MVIKKAKLVIVSGILGLNASQIIFIVLIFTNCWIYSVIKISK